MSSVRDNKYLPGLRWLLSQKGMSVHDLEEKSGLKYQFLLKTVNGKQSFDNMKYSTVRAIAEAMGYRYAEDLINDIREHDEKHLRISKDLNPKWAATTKTLDEILDTQEEHGHLTKEACQELASYGFKKYDFTRKAMNEKAQILREVASMVGLKDMMAKRNIPKLIDYHGYVIVDLFSDEEIQD